MKTYKGFDENLKCRNFQYVVGEKYTHDGEVIRCTKGGFHSCKNPIDVFTYYPPGHSRFGECTIGGDIDTDDTNSKVASAEIIVDKEIGVVEFVNICVKHIMDNCITAQTNTGDYSAATNTGDHSAAINTGYKSAATNTGNHSAATNTGNKSAATNTGDYSAASVEGGHSVACGVGYENRVRGANGCVIFSVYRDEDYGEIIHHKSAMCGVDVEADTWYILNSDGEFEKVKD